MSYLKSTAFAAMLGLASLGFSGQLASASAEPVKQPAAKVYANNTDLGGQPSVTEAQAMPEGKDALDSQMRSGVSSGWDIRARTGFYGYR